MGNIIGEGFNSFIKEQVEKRQEIYGSRDRDPQINTFLNSRTGWVRMGSSVNVLVDPRGIGLVDSELAKSYVLFNGVSQYTNSEIPTQISGITNTDTINSNSAYGIGGTEQGIVPMPGITSVNTKTETRGSLKTSTVSIKCYNKIQFDIIDTLYLRLGFTMLLEWGNSSYYNNNGTYESDNRFNLMDNFLGIGKKILYSNYYLAIEARRGQSNGNYDALLGKVVNFDWTFNKDGSYDITVILRSMGDVIESLKANTLLGVGVVSNVDDYKEEIKKKKKFLEELKKQGNPATDNVLVALYNFAFGTDEENEVEEEIATLNALLNNEELFRGDEEAEGRGNVYANRNASTLGSWIYDHLQQFESLDTYRTKSIGKTRQSIQTGIPAKAFVNESNSTNGITSLTQPLQGKQITSFIRQQYENNAHSPHYFIHFGFLLNFVKNYLIPVIEVSDDKLFNMDINLEENIIILGSKQYPTDNRICQVSYDIKSLDEKGQETNLYYLSSGEKFERYENQGKNRYGKIMNIYFNVDFVLEAIAKNTTNGSTTLIDFLTELCDGWNDSTGNYSKLSPSFVEERNTLRIIDENPLPDKDTFLKEQNTSTKLTYFNVYGINSSTSPNAGFVSDFSFKTAITPQLATMITVGANSNGQITGVDATGISRMNNGFRDRIKPIIISANTAKDEAEAATADSTEKEFKSTLKNFNQYLSELGSKNDESKPTFNPENVNSFKNAAKFLIEYDQSKKTQAKQNQEEKNPLTEAVQIAVDKYATASTGFLPFSLSLTMDGLSGMKIYQKFSVDTDFLPSNYPTSLEFLISGIENSISGNKWTTKIESIAVPKNPFSPTVNKIVTFKRITAPVIQSKSKSLTITSGFPLNPTGHADKEFTKTQIVLHYSAGWQLADKGKQTIDFLNKRDQTKAGGDKGGLSYHYIIDGTGHSEQLIQSNYRAFHAGNANPNSVGISLQNIGFKRAIKGSIYNGQNGDKVIKITKPSNQSNFVQLVDFDGNPRPYRGKSYAQEITDGQFAELKRVYLSILSENPSIPPIEWNKDTFNQLWPSKGLSYSKSKPGYYTHCSIDLGKNDCLPTPRIIEFFKSLQAAPTEKELLDQSEKSFRLLTEDINRIFKLVDKFGDDGTPLFEDFKGTINDDEGKARTALNLWLQEPKQANAIARLSNINANPNGKSKSGGANQKIKTKSDLSSFNDTLEQLRNKLIYSGGTETIYFYLYRKGYVEPYKLRLKLDVDF
tara:strand:+ start:19 stop:3729 length:3711 start_codon:yes stop_codon:yes gene_type:complete